MKEHLVNKLQQLNAGTAPKLTALPQFYRSTEKVRKLVHRLVNPSYQHQQW